MQRLSPLRISLCAIALVVVAPAAVSALGADLGASEPVEAAMGSEAASAQAEVIVHPPLAELVLPNPARLREQPSEWIAQAAATGRTLGATVRSTATPVSAWVDPDDSGEPAWAIPALSEFNSPLVLAVVGAEGDMLKVQIPLRPNGSEGWVRAADFDLHFVSTSIVVDVSDRTLSYFDHGELVFTETVTVGRDAHPTPLGAFYLRDSFPWDANSVYGAYVMPLSAYSESIDTINGGEAVVAIHGTKRPEELGQAKSLGCIRMPNDRITEMAASIELGTWVQIVP